MTLFFVVLLVNLGVFFFRVAYVLLYPIDLSPEEAQYWDWSRHLDMSYYSKPPMVAYLNFLSTSFLGNTEIAVRITPMLLSFLLSLLTFWFVRKLYDERIALFSSLLPNLFVGTSINSILMTTDAPFIFFWSLSVMLIYIASEKNSSRAWLLVGVFAGLSFLSKYPAVLLLPLTITYLYVVKKEALRSPVPYLSLIPAFLLSLPVLIWNLERDFVSFKHVSSLAGKQASFPNLSTFSEFIGGQILLMSLFPFFFMAYGWWKTFKLRDRRLIFLTTFSLPVFLLFSLLSLRKEVYANWAGFAYFTGSILASLYMKKLYESRKALFLSFLSFQAFLVLLLHFTPLADLLGLRSLLPPKRDPVKVMVGWEKLGREVSELYTGKELLFSNAYQVSAELAFYVRGNPRTFVFHLGRMTQYYFWKDELKKYRGKDAIFVSEGDVPREVRKHFRGQEFLKRVDIVWRGEKIRSFNVFRLRDFEGRFDDVPKGF